MAEVATFPTNEQSEEVEAPEAGDPIVVTSEEDYFKVVERYKSEKSTMDTARAEIGALLKNAENDYQLHRAAFKLVQKLKGQDSAKRADFMRAFAAYFKYEGLDDQLDMFAA